MTLPEIVAQAIVLNAVALARIQADPSLKWTCRLYDGGTGIPVIEIAAPRVPVRRGNCAPVQGQTVPRFV